MARFEHNKALLAFLETHEADSGFSDWFVTGAFYAAVHRVEAMFTVVKPHIKGRFGTITVIEHCAGHRERSAVIGRCFERIHGAYTTLYGYSRIAKFRNYITIPIGSKSAKELLQNIEDMCDAYLTAVTP
jgi:hypothetical protein